MLPSRDQRNPTTEAVRAALFKVVSTADLTDSEQAVQWARSALEDEALLTSLGAGARRVAGAGETPPGDG